MIITKKQTVLFALLIISILLFAIVQVQSTAAQQIGTQQFGVSSIIFGVQSSADNTNSQLMTEADNSKQVFVRLGGRLGQDLPAGQANNKIKGLLAEAEMALSEFADSHASNVAAIEDLGTAKNLNELNQKWTRLRPELDTTANKIDKSVDNMKEITNILNKI